MAALACNLAPALVATPTPSPATAPIPETAEPGLPPVTPGEAPPGGTPEVEVFVFFTNIKRFNLGTPPFESAVTRRAPAGANLPEFVLAAFFKGPTEQERQMGLELVASGFTGFSRLEIQDGVARVYLEGGAGRPGECRSNGAAYTVASPLVANLAQFPEIETIKIYDAAGETEQPDGPENSIPFCLEP